MSFNILLLILYAFTINLAVIFIFEGSLRTNFNLLSMVISSKLFGKVILLYHSSRSILYTLHENNESQAKVALDLFQMGQRLALWIYLD